MSFIANKKRVGLSACGIARTHSFCRCFGGSHAFTSTRQDITGSLACGPCAAGRRCPRSFYLGVLDRLLEEPKLQLDGISGTSAGAMNAAVLVDGYAKGGAEGARRALEAFWRRVSRASQFSPFRRGPLDVLFGRWTLDYSPTFLTMDMVARLFSPYDLNPGGTNPCAPSSPNPSISRIWPRGRSSCS
ncbi:patatin-like phospholipase family protein [Azotobacter chroococcum]